MQLNKNSKNMLSNAHEICYITKFSFLLNHVETFLGIILAKYQFNMEGLNRNCSSIVC